MERPNGKNRSNTRSNTRSGDKSHNDSLPLRTCIRCKLEFKSNRKSSKCNNCYKYINCIDCKSEFLTKDLKHNRCNDCYNKKTKICTICERAYMPKDYPNHVYGWDKEKDTKCSGCWGTFFRNCKECNSKYATHVSRFNEPYELYCGICSKKRNRIMNDKTIEGDHNQKFRIIVTYSTTECTHDGYCSDPSNIEETQSTKTVEYPLIKAFSNHNEYIDREGNVIINSYQWPLSYYNLEDSSHGYCGCETTNTIISARIVKAEREIDLDDCPSDDDKKNSYFK